MLTLHAVIKFFLSFSLFLILFFCYSCCQCAPKIPIHTQNSCPPLPHIDVRMCARARVDIKHIQHLHIWINFDDFFSRMPHAQSLFQKWCYTYTHIRIYFSPQTERKKYANSTTSMFVYLHSTRSTITYVILHFKQILMRPPPSIGTTAGGPQSTWMGRLGTRQIGIV